MNDLLENAKRNSKITLEEFFFEFYSKILEEVYVNDFGAQRTEGSKRRD